MHSKHAMPFGADVTPDGVRFALWAPSARTVTLDCDGRRTEMDAAGQGWFRTLDRAARAGDRYGFLIDGAEDLVPDPASRRQDEDADRRSTVIDPDSYDWQDGGWRARPFEEVALCEVHVGTATRDGTFEALAAKLRHYKNTGFTAIELMPIAETPGQRGWGYDGVLPFAPNNAYGQPDDLKRLIDQAHSLGLMVFLDVVYNHFGPSGNFLHGYAESFFTDRHTTPWGAGINFDGASAASDVVREFFIQNALYWLDEYHIDGLRFDAVHAILDDSERHVLDELAGRLRTAFPQRHIHLVLENEANEARRLTRDGDGDPITYDAQWNDDYHHCWHVLLTKENEGYYRDFGGDTLARLGRGLAEGFVYQADYSENLGRLRGERSRELPPQAFVAFLQNHDQIGNRAQGERLTALADPAQLALARAALLLGPQIPMLFMGEEWGSRTPFLFFVHFDHDPALEEAVRKGRAKEFEKFSSFGGGVDVPDPTARETFERSKIVWSERDVPPYAQVFEDTRALLALRHRETVPLLKSGFIGAEWRRQGPEGLDVTWRFHAGTLRFIANFAATPLLVAPETDATIVWTSDGVASHHSLTLPAWTGAFLKTRSE